MLMRALLIAFAVFLLAPILLSALIPGMARSAMGVSASGWRNAAQTFEVRLDDIQECSALLNRINSVHALAYRTPEAACGMCARLLAAIPDPAVTEATPLQIRALVASDGGKMHALRQELGARSESLRRAFARRDYALSRAEDGELNPVRTTIDLQSSLQCEAPA